MARHGDGLYLRGQTWYLDCRLNGTLQGQADRLCSLGQDPVVLPALTQ
jgi:hypothetical protein